MKKKASQNGERSRKVSIRVVARKLGVSHTTVLRWLGRDDLPEWKMRALQDAIAEVKKEHGK